MLLGGSVDVAVGKGVSLSIAPSACGRVAPSVAVDVGVGRGVLLGGVLLRSAVAFCDVSAGGGGREGSEVAVRTAAGLPLTIGRPPVPAMAPAFSHPSNKITAPRRRTAQPARR